jgi:hypothetical protein
LSTEVKPPHEERFSFSGAAFDFLSLVAGTLVAAWRVTPSARPVLCLDGTRPNDGAAELNSSRTSAEEVE